MYYSKVCNSVSSDAAINTKNQDRAHVHNAIGSPQIFHDVQCSRQSELILRAACRTPGQRVSPSKHHTELIHRLSLANYTSGIQHGFSPPLILGKTCTRQTPKSMPPYSSLLNLKQAVLSDLSCLSRPIIRQWILLNYGGICCWICC